MSSQSGIRPSTSSSAGASMSRPISTSISPSPSTLSQKLLASPAQAPFLTSSPSAPSPSTATKAPVSLPSRFTNFVNHFPGGRIPKYRQPPSTAIPYPRGGLDIFEAIKQRRAVPTLGKMDGYGVPVDAVEDDDEWEDGYEEEEEQEQEQVVIVRYKTLGGRAKRIWERVAFWDSVKRRTEERTV